MQKKYLSLIGYGFQMAVLIYAGAKGGKWMDNEYQNPKPVFTMIGILLAFFISLYFLMRQLKKINDEDN